jgi:hypothetical protein
LFAPAGASETSCRADRVAPPSVERRNHIRFFRYLPSLALYRT